jgi:hypothetical protein
MRLKASGAFYFKSSTKTSFWDMVINTTINLILSIDQ